MPRARSRRVQAQRKFAQGAYVPPNAVAVAAVDSRRDAAQDARNVTHNNMSATSLLDVVSMQGAAALPDYYIRTLGVHPHLKPVVLVERLCGRTTSCDASPQREPIPCQPRINDCVITTQKPSSPKLISVKKRIHAMSLRSRRLSKLEYNKLLALNSTSTRRLAPKRKHIAKTVKSAKSKKKNLLDQLDMGSEFSFDDNRPLLYFKHTSTPNRPMNVDPVMEPYVSSPVLQFQITDVRPASPDMQFQITDVRPASPDMQFQITDVRPASPDMQFQITDVRPASPDMQFHITDVRAASPEMQFHITDVRAISPDTQFHITDVRPATPDGLLEISVTQPHVASPVTHPHFVDPEPVAGPSGLQLSSISCNPSEPSEDGTYYSEQKIHCWMDSSLERQIRTENLQLDNCLSTSSTTICIAEKYRTGQDVLDAPKDEFDSRCQNCPACKRIDKLFKLSTLIKSQVKFDLTGNDQTLPLGSTELPIEKGRPAENNYLFMNLLPEHPTMMLKLRTYICLGKEILSACLISKSNFQANHQHLMLKEQEYLIDQLIETLSLSLEQPPVNRESISSGDSVEVLEYLPEQAVVDQRSERSRITKRSRLATSARRMVEMNQLKAEVKAEKEAELARILEKNREEISRIQEEKNNIEAEKNSIAAEVSRMTKERETEMARLRAEIRAELEADRRFREEVDGMARALDKEKDAKSMDAGQSSEYDINAPSTSGAVQAPEGGTLMDAPIFRPTAEEFTDPIKYFIKIWPAAFKYGICKVVPPEGWNPTCYTKPDMNFHVSNQYISRLFSRWGTAARELCAIKLCLHQQKIAFKSAPVVDGVEVDLPKLYHLVQRHGGLQNVLNKNKWGKVAEDLKLAKTPQTERKLDQIYVKYLLPYDTLSQQERQEIMKKVEKAWNKKNQTLLDRAMNPLYRQKRMMGERDSSGDDIEDEETAIALKEAEDCITKGSQMTLAKFQKIAATVNENVFGHGSEAAEPPELSVIEEQYWRNVIMGTEHQCVHAASVDTSEGGYGFTKNKNEPFGSHPWNLKRMSQHPGNVLRYLGPVLGVTVPSLHLGMLFSTNCWHKDPHALPWKEYQHKGPTRIWYGIPSSQTDNFRAAVETLTPTSCQNKALWLPSDIAMIPPHVLREHNVTLSRVTQEAGEFILAFPRCYTCCISTGYTESESVYFAPASWLETLPEVFKEARESCEPTMFSMESLLYYMGKDQRTEPSVLQIAQPIFEKLLREEGTNRQMLQEKHLKFVQEKHPRLKRNKALNPRYQEECEYCRATLFFSKVTGLTELTLCLEHAIKILDARKCKNKSYKGVTVHIYLTLNELNIVNDDMKRRINAAAS